MTKVAQIIPYFGKWPEWFPLYLYSCSRNPMVDFIFYTDCDTPDIIYNNTKFISISFKEYCSLVGRRLGIEYKIKNPYKLTDLKPFLGAIHQKELKNYEFWSFGDIDLCYGDLSILLNERTLERYDLLTTHCYHIAGHFTVLRNNDFYRNLCFKIPNWQTRLCDDKHYAFDEGEWPNMVFRGLFFNRLIWNKIVSKLKITDFFSFMDFANRINGGRRLFKEFFTSPNPAKDQVWTYDIDKGTVQNPIGKELPYIHFLFFKKTQYLNTDKYWRPGYYKITKSDLNKPGRIVFSLDGIEHL